MNQSLPLNQVLHGDCLDRMQELPDSCVDSIITDPPYGLGFMGKRWDHDVPSTLVFEEMLRVAKPGAFLLCFAGTRKWHRMAVNIEDAGWQIRDTIMYLYGSGMPKSYDISKGIDRSLGAEREILATVPDRWSGKGNVLMRSTQEESESVNITAPASDDAKRWDGWGTALKPAVEPVIVAMKPVEDTFVKNALEHGVAGLNINECRIGGVDTRQKTGGAIEGTGWGTKSGAIAGSALGRFPANVILDEESARLLDKQTGTLKSGEPMGVRAADAQRSVFGSFNGGTPVTGYGDMGGASRFFYTAKASRAEREAGLEGLPLRNAGNFDDDGHREPGERKNNHTAPQPVRNHHPTVKPLDLMQYLCRLTKTPTGGVVLDPFLGSGTTAVAARLEGRSFIGIEKESEYVEIARARIKPYLAQKTISEMIFGGASS